MQDVFKLKAEKYRQCKFWGCFENGDDDAQVARRRGRRRLRQEDLKMFREETDMN